MVAAGPLRSVSMGDGVSGGAGQIEILHRRHGDGVAVHSCVVDRVCPQISWPRVTFGRTFQHHSRGATGSRS